MFEELVTFTGKHGYYMKKLTELDLSNEEKMSIFTRNIDVYLASSIVGYINGRKEEEEIGDYKNISAKIAVEQLIKEQKKLVTIFRTIMLLDTTVLKDEESQIRRAFRDDANKDLIDNHRRNMELFNSYARGGISILYESLVANAAVKDDYLKNIMHYIKLVNTEAKGITDEELETQVGYSK